MRGGYNLDTMDIGELPSPPIMVEPSRLSTSRVISLLRNSNP